MVNPASRVEEIVEPLRVRVVYEVVVADTYAIVPETIVLLKICKIVEVDRGRVVVLRADMYDVTWTGSSRRVVVEFKYSCTVRTVPETIVLLTVCRIVDVDCGRVVVLLADTYEVTREPLSVVVLVKVPSAGD